MASFATVSCNEDFKDWEQPQSIPQGPDKDVVTAAANLLSNTIDYDATETSKVTLLTQSFITGVDAAQLVYSNLKINGVDIPCTSEDGNLIVALDDIKKACETFYHSKAHTTRLMECTVKASSLDDDGVAVPAQLTVDAATVDSFAFQFTTPELPAIAYEDAYYYIGGYNGWNLSAPTPMEKNEDGTFSVILDIGDSEWFCFAPQSAHRSQLLTIKIGTDSSVPLPMATPPLRASSTRTVAVAIPSSARRVALSSSPFLLRIGHSPMLLTLRNSITQAMPMDGASHHS